MFVRVSKRRWLFDAVLHRAGLVRTPHHLAPTLTTRSGAFALAMPSSGIAMIAPAPADMPSAVVSNRSAQQGEEAK